MDGYPQLQIPLRACAEANVTAEFAKAILPAAFFRL